MKHTILGAGPVGRAAAAALVARGHDVHIVSRHAPVELPARVVHHATDVRDASALAVVVAGSEVIYQCMAAPYNEWTEHFPALQQAAVEAARRAGARFVSFENVYMYGRPQAAAFGEDAPFAPASQKGRVRTQMAAALAAIPDLAVAHVRASDLFGPGMRASALGEEILGRVVRGLTARGLGDLDAPHTWTFTLDAGETLARVGEGALRGVFHVPSETARSQREVARALEGLVARPVNLTATPSWLLRVVGLVRPEAGELVEMLYEFESPFLVDDHRTRQALGQSPTPFLTALRQTVDSFRHEAERRVA